MITITRNAETDMISLIDALKAGRNDHGSCCLHIRGRALGDDVFDQLPHLLDKWIGDPAGRVLVCEDGDVFVVSGLITPKFHTRFCEMLNTRLGYEPNRNNTIVALYDWHAHIAALEAIARDKRARIMERESREEEKRKTAALNTQANAELVTTLDRRRAARKALQILVIEDDLFSRRMIGVALTPDFDAAFAESGTSGIREYLGLAPDVVFLDINLPDISGLEVLHKLREIDPDAYVVMLSGNGSADNVMQAVQNGAKGFVGKPFARDKLHQMIKRSPKFIQKRKEA